MILKKMKIREDEINYTKKIPRMKMLKAESIFKAPTKMKELEWEDWKDNSHCFHKKINFILVFHVSHSVPLLFSHLLLKTNKFKLLLPPLHLFDCCQDDNRQCKRDLPIFFGNDVKHLRRNTTRECISTRRRLCFFILNEKGLKLHSRNHNKANRFISNNNDKKR